MKSWLMQMLGLRRPEPPLELVRVKVRSDAVLAKARRVVVEQQRVELMRGSFKRAEDRIGG